MKRFTVKELAQKYGVQNRIVQGWIERGKFPNAEKQGRRLFVPESDLEGFTPQRRRGRALSANPSKRALYRRNLRAHLKKQAESPAEELPTFYLSKKIDEKLDEMCRLYEDEKWNLQQIADHLGVSIPAIRDRLVKAGIKIRPRKSRKRYLDRETLIRLYVDENLGMVKVAEILETTYRKVRDELARHGIKKR